MRVALAFRQVFPHDPNQQIRPKQVEGALERQRSDLVAEGDDRANGQVEPAEVERDEAVPTPAVKEVRSVIGQIPALARPPRTGL